MLGLRAGSLFREPEVYQPRQDEQPTACPEVSSSSAFTRVHHPVSFVRPFLLFSPTAMRLITQPKVSSTQTNTCRSPDMSPSRDNTVVDGQLASASTRRALRRRRTAVAPEARRPRRVHGSLEGIHIRRTTSRTRRASLGPGGTHALEARVRWRRCGVHPCSDALGTPQRRRGLRSASARTAPVTVLDCEISSIRFVSTGLMIYTANIYNGRSTL
ncbi:hypothetical protein OH77DRAFT_1021027 [Trametes cingulata]|nr:hypothetical protein OH77DRAFT_1021027 [Trametes cingulata]